MSDRIIACSFSGAAAELPKGQRTDTDVLLALAASPRVSTFDLSEHRWLSSCIESLKRAGLIVLDEVEPYPWFRYKLTQAGLDAAVAALRASDEPKLRASESPAARHIGKEVEALGYWMQEIAAQVHYYAGFNLERREWANKLETAGAIVQGWGLSWCTKCGGTMAPGVAMGQTATGSPDELGGDVVTMSLGGPGKLIDCLKCSGCGHSVSR